MQYFFLISLIINVSLEIFTKKQYQALFKRGLRMTLLVRDTTSPGVLGAKFKEKMLSGISF